MTSTRIEETARVFSTISGGSGLLKRFRGSCDFHDAEIVGLDLNRSGSSRLRLFWWNIEKSDDGFYKSADHAIVVFDIERISDIGLSGFSRQNVIDSFSLSICGKDPERSKYYDFCATDADYHLQIEHCYGLSGFIRCGGISVRIEPGKPLDDVHTDLVKDP